MREKPTPYEGVRGDGKGITAHNAYRGTAAIPLLSKE